MYLETRFAGRELIAQGERRNGIGTGVLRAEGDRGRAEQRIETLTEVVADGCVAVFVHPAGSIDDERRQDIEAREILTIALRNRKANSAVLQAWLTELVSFKHSEHTIAVLEPEPQQDLAGR